MALRPGRRASVGAHQKRCTRPHELFVEAHMGGELIGEAAHLAPAHGVGLAGQRERPHAGAPDAAGGEVAIDDGIDFVRAARRLVDALRIERHHPLRAREPIEEARDRAGRQIAGVRRFGDGERGLERRVETGAMLRNEILIDRAGFGEVAEQSVEQRCVAAGLEGQVQIGAVGAYRAARIDHDEAHVLPRRPGGFDALEKHRMAPGGIGADQHDEVGLLQILVAAGHGIGAEGARMSGDRRGHAQARIGVDIGGADETLHQLVGDVIVLGQKLAGDIERDRVGPVRGDGRGEGVGDRIERRVPGCTGAVDFRFQDAARQADRLAERRAFHAEAAAIGGMLGIAGDGQRPVAQACQHAAADAAIGTGGAHRISHRRASPYG